MVADPIADLITRLKNASAVGKVDVSVPFSKLSYAIAEFLKREGFVKEVEKRGKKVKKSIDLKLSHADGMPGIRGVERVSRLSRRVYLKSGEIRPVKFGEGMMVISTSSGLRTDREARKEGLGGEALFKIW